MRPTLKDVCRDALVSEATVSRVINNSPLVHERTRARVQEVIRRLGYTPNAAARNLSRSKTDTIGVVFHQMSSGFFAQVMDGIDRAARQHGYHILSAFTRNDQEREREQSCLRLLDEMRADGVIILDPCVDLKLMESLKRYHKPIVVLQQEIDDVVVSSVSIDNRQGAYEGMKHLLALGYRDILVVRGAAGAQDARLRLEGCEQALREAGVTQRLFIDGHYSPHDAVEAFRVYCQSHPLPRAIFALNDAMALALHRELRKGGVEVPGQVAILGFDGIEAAEYVGLTTVETPMAEMGEEAVRVFLRRLEAQDAPAEHIRLPTRLVIRSTTA